MIPEFEHSLILDKIATLFSTIFILGTLEHANTIIHIIVGMLMMLFWTIRIWEKITNKNISDYWKKKEEK